MRSGQSPLQPVDALLLLATRWVKPVATHTIATVGGRVPSDLSDQSDLSDSRHLYYRPQAAAKGGMSRHAHYRRRRAILRAAGEFYKERAEGVYLCTRSGFVLLRRDKPKGRNTTPWRAILRAAGEFYKERAEGVYFRTRPRRKTQ